jgi:hypothetical protein
MAKNKNIPPQEIQDLLKKVSSHFYNEDRSVRERQVLTWRRLKLLWDGFSQVWFDEVAHDWRIFDETAYGDEDGYQGYYDKPVNVFRAYLESIIAALSVTVPPVTCYPKDATDELDLLTARSGDKIAELIYRHNNLSLEWLHALFIWCTEGMVASHIYSKKSKKYGTYEEDEYENQIEETNNLVCPNCEFIF